MRHKYTTEALILARRPFNEAGVMVTLVTRDFGLVTARAEGARRQGAKLAHALQTLTQSDLVLVRGKEGWRVTGALLTQDYFTHLSRGARLRAARISGLLQRFFGPDIPDERVYADFIAFMTALAHTEEETQDSLETLIALKLLSHMGVLDGEAVPDGFTEASLSYARTNRKELIGRINRGISTTGL